MGRGVLCNAAMSILVPLEEKSRILCVAATMITMSRYQLL
jgi:hypothetical protein